MLPRVTYRTAPRPNVARELKDQSNYDLGTPAASLRGRNRAGGMPALRETRPSIGDYLKPKLLLGGKDFANAQIVTIRRRCRIVDCYSRPARGRRAVPHL